MPAADDLARLKGLLSEGGDKLRADGPLLLKHLRKALMESGFLTEREALLSENDRVMYRDIIECDALYRLNSGEIQRFMIAMKQLKVIYFRGDALPQSARAELILCAHLICLAGFSMQEFVVDLTRIVQAFPKGNLIQYAVDIHEALMDNSLSRVLKLAAAPPSPVLLSMMGDITKIAREMQASAVEGAYRALSLKQLAQLLRFDGVGSARDFAVSRGWEVSGDQVSFVAIREARSPPERMVANVSLAARLRALG